MRRSSASPDPRASARRPSGSPARLGEAGAEARVEEETFRDGFAGLLAGIATGTAASGLAALLPGGRPLGVAGGAVATALVADDISNGPRLARRAVAEEKTTWNAVAEIGPADAERTLVMLSHHDAARTGALFDPRAQRAAGEALPGIVERFDTSVPLWWAAIAAPLLVAVGAATRRRR